MFLVVALITLCLSALVGFIIYCALQRFGRI